nr:hypothetical protein BaRGS_009996 [Batillaria attramentaria]
MRQDKFGRYRWVKSTEPGSRCSVGNSQGGRQKDIRDPLYLNTYCPGERKLRFKKTSSSLPRIFSRNRPWTVSESNPAYSLEYLGQTRIKYEEEDRESTVSGSQALLEVKSYFPHAEGEQPLEDQREGLRGKEGCLHSRVKQCIKFVKHRDRMASRVERPMKQEHGKYRPFSTTRTRLVSAVHKRRKTKHPVSGLPRYNTAASSYYDNYDARTLQSVADYEPPSRFQRHHHRRYRHHSAVRRFEPRDVGRRGLVNHEGAEADGDDGDVEEEEGEEGGG